MAILHRIPSTRTLTPTSSSVPISKDLQLFSLMFFPSNVGSETEFRNTINLANLTPKRRYHIWSRTLQNLGRKGWNFHFFLDGVPISCLSLYSGTTETRLLLRYSAIWGELSLKIITY